MAANRLLLRIFVLCVFIGGLQCKDCTITDACSCEYDDGSGTVDLSSLSATNGDPRFKDVKCDHDNTYYSYNVCEGFSEDDCQGSVLCALMEDKSISTPLGQPDQVQFQYDPDSGNLQAGYLIPGTPIETLEIEMVCDSSACEPSFVPLGLTGATYNMQLTSVCACPGMCDSKGPTVTCSGSSTGLSAGSFLLIGFFSIVVVYIVSGVSYQKVKNKASGSDLLPNKALWTHFGVLVKSGFSMVFCNVRGSNVHYNSV